MDLDAMYEKAAEACEAAGVAIDDTPGGPVHEWVMRNVRHRVGTTFFIVLGIAGAMADRDARRQGSRSSADRAAHFAGLHGSYAAAGLPNPSRA